MNNKALVTLFTILLAGVSLYSLMQVLDKEVWRIIFAALGFLVFTTFSVMIIKADN